MGQSGNDTEIATYVLNKIFIPTLDFRIQGPFIYSRGEAAYKEENPGKIIYSKLKENSIKKFLISNLNIIPNDIDFPKKNFQSKFFKYKNKLLYNRYIETLWGFIETEEKKNKTEEELLNIIYTRQIYDNRNKPYTMMLERIAESLTNDHCTFININSDKKTDAHYNFFKVYKLIDFFLKMYTYFYTTYYDNRSYRTIESSWDYGSMKYKDIMIGLHNDRDRMYYLKRQINSDKWYKENNTEIYFTTFLINLNRRIILQYKDENVVLKTEYIILKDIKDEIVNVSTRKVLYSLSKHRDNIAVEIAEEFTKENGIKSGIFKENELTLNPKGQSGGVNIRCKSRSYTKKKKNKNQSHTKKKNQSYKKKYNMRMQRKTRRKL